MISRLARSIAYALLERIQSGSLTVIEGPHRRTFGTGVPVAVVQVRSLRTWPWLIRASNGLAESYARQLWDSPDLTAVMRVAARNARGLDAIRSSLAPLLIPLQRLRALRERNTAQRRRRDIAAHYDLGNRLFELMLDPSMSYSCAVFEREDASLHEAALAKIDLVCKKLDVKDGDRVLEIGGGWGALALHAAAAYGARVTTTTISLEQHRYMLERVRSAGLQDRVTVLLEDYRNLRGSYEKLVSIEMIEAVGWRYFGTFFECCSRLLAPGGKMLLQAITIDEIAYAVEKASKSFMNTYIFPNGCLPSLGVLETSVQRHTDLSILDVDDLTEHYVPTLRHWRANLQGNAQALADLGYDQRFQRIWRLYLSYCEAGFAERRIRDLQLLLSKPEQVGLGPARGRALRALSAAVFG